MQNDRRVDGSSVLTEMQSYSLFLFLCCRLDFYLFLSLFFKQSLLISNGKPNRKLFDYLLQQILLFCYLQNGRQLLFSKNCRENCDLVKNL